MHITDLDNFVKLVLGSSHCSYCFSCLKKETCIKSCLNWLKNNHLTIKSKSMTHSVDVSFHSEEEKLIPLQKSSTYWMWLTSGTCWHKCLSSRRCDRGCRLFQMSSHSTSGRRTFQSRCWTSFLVDSPQQARQIDSCWCQGPKYMYTLIESKCICWLLKSKWLKIFS